MQRVALNAFSQSANISLSKLHISDTIAITEKEQKVFTIFNFKEGGYIIVSNEDVTEPILGYGFESNINLDNIPPGLEFLLNEYKNEIYSSTKNELAATQEIKERWERYTSTDQSIQTIKSYTVGDILLETEWNQNAGYQQCCPNYPGTQTSCVVGCAGVALGQILYYWNCRTFPQGIVKYLPENFQDSVTVNLFQDYKWNFMGLDSPDTLNSKFLYHCAASLESNFGLNKTTPLNTDIIWWALRNRWGFNTGNVQLKDDYPSTWISLLRNEIDNERPIYYFGHPCDTCDGHAWVIDGYRTSDNKFHCNWGWGGDYNDWFTLSDLTPGSENFNSYQMAIMGIYPKADECTELSGPSPACSGNIYSVNNLDITTIDSIIWTPGPYITVSSGQNTDSCTISVTGSGVSSIQVRLVKNGQSIIFSKYLWAGTPVITGLDGPMSVPTNEDTRYYPLYGYPIASPTNFEWNVTPDASYDSYGWSTLVNFPYPDVYHIIYRGLNTCGWGDWYYSDNIYVYSSRSLSISPNPASGETIISIETDDKNAASAAETEETAFDETAEWSLEIYDNVQSLKMKKTSLKGRETTINAQSWKEGVYFVRVLYKNEVLTGKLVVKK